MLRRTCLNNYEVAMPSANTTLYDCSYTFSRGQVTPEARLLRHVHMRAMYAKLGAPSTILTGPCIKRY
jgi:hypothetical protein